MSITEKTAKVAVKFKDITKTFGSVIANKDVTVEVFEGEVS